MYKLVIADDERVIRETISTIINWGEYNIEVVGVCKDGIEALDSIMDESPDLVMTDIRMPGLSGLELIEKINTINPDIEFVILSGYGEFEYAQRAMESGVKYYLLKPCNEEDIIKAVNGALVSIDKKAEDELSSIIEQLFSETDKGDLRVKCEDILLRSQNFNFIKRSLQQLLFEASTSSNHPLSQVKIMDFLNTISSLEDLISLHNLCTEILDSIFNEKQPKNSDFIEKLICYISDHIENPDLSLKWISENYLYMNPDYVSKQFVKQTGVKFSTYLTDLRVAKAKEFLQTEGSDGIKEVAEKVGFGNNPQYFNQIFKKYTSMTPCAYVKSI